MLTQAQRQPMIQIIAQFPEKLAAALAGLSHTQLTTSYLDEEWTVAQNVHHLADSHMNSFIRLKLILTEDKPTIKPYDQEAWAKMPDEVTPVLDGSLTLLQGLHQRWTQVFESLEEADWRRMGYHPEIGQITVDDLLQIYADHCTEHLDQIQRTLAAAT